MFGKRSLLMALAAGILALTGGRSAPTTVAPRGSIGTLSPQAIYSRESKEHYLTAEQADFTRPGYHIKINSVTIGADRKPVIDVSLTDDLGAPLDRNGVQTPGACTASFVLSWYEPTTRNYTNYATRKQTSAITGASGHCPLVLFTAPARRTATAPASS